VIDVIRELQSFGTQIDIYDPEADEQEVKHEYNLTLTKSLQKKYHAIILAVGHQVFNQLDWDAIKVPNAVVYDVKGILERTKITARL
jgi:UDP-N-acetyl-D-galactosamine dehydrogenase